MRRITTATRAVDLFGVGKSGFKDGNLGLGVAPTDFNADWPNQVQEEIASVIEAAGIVLDGNTRNQVLLALRGAGVFQTATLGDNTTKAATTGFLQASFAASKAANGWQKLTSGLIIQWGSIATANYTTPNSFRITPVTFPMAFPSAVYSVVGSLNLGNSGTAYANSSAESATLSGFNFVYSAGGSTTTPGMSYIAIGI